MRYSQSEKMEIIRLVEQSPLSVKQTLLELNINRSTFYNWYRRYRQGGYEALAKLGTRITNVDFGRVDVYAFANSMERLSKRVHRIAVAHERVALGDDSKGEPFVVADRLIEGIHSGSMLEWRQSELTWNELAYVPERPPKPLVAVDGLSPGRPDKVAGSVLEGLLRIE